MAGVPFFIEKVVRMGYNSHIDIQEGECISL